MALPASDNYVELGDTQAAQLGYRHKTQTRFDDHGQRSFGPYHEAFQRISRSSHTRGGSKGEKLSVRHDHLHRQDRIARRAVFDGASAGCIICDFSANGCRQLEAGVGG